MEDQKIHATHQIAWDYPWHHVKHTDQVDCHLWHRVMFDVVNESLPTEKKFVPSKCQECWKVVVKPKTLKQLFSLLDLQIKLDRPSKCGIETRPGVKGHYGGYFYNRSFDEGVECYKEVRDNIKKSRILKPLLKEVDENGIYKRILLKRGCTEFEYLLGRSDMWSVTEEQLEMENLIEEAFYRQLSSEMQPQFVINHIHRKWIEFAWDRDDETVMQFTNGKLINPPYVTYHYIAEGMAPITNCAIKMISEDEFKKLQIEECLQEESAENKDGNLSPVS